MLEVSNTFAPEQPPIIELFGIIPIEIIPFSLESVKFEKSSWLKSTRKQVFIYLYLPDLIGQDLS